MLPKRIIVCLDVRDGRLTKGVKFQDNIDLGDPVDAARRYCEEGADEIIFYDITASAENRSLFLDVAERVAQAVSLPFCVGGGLSTVAQMRAVLKVGAAKVSLNSAAVRNPALIREGSEAFGSQAIVVGIDARRAPISPAIPSGYETVIDGGRLPTGRDALAWAREAEALGAGEICLNSIDADGVKNGYELNLTAAVAEAVRIPVIASGGAGHPRHLLEVLTRTRAAAALVASIVHFREYGLKELKDYLRAGGCPVLNTPGAPSP
ncbi:MAG: imidazole glycerol phosphate synthase subunit HisF [Deltaproteobacteria bacterium]|nr:imidazole glycerol phosphate synthase subunit HisF [Deltaproteobacteria bacterium]